MSFQCVVRHRRGEGIDSRLLDALTTKSIHVSTTTDNSHGAFAEVCKLARAGSRLNVLVVTDIDDREENAALFRALERYPVQTRMWIYDADGGTGMRAANASDFEAANVTMPKIDVHPPVASRPVLRLIDHPLPKPDPNPAEFELTDEELIALTAPPPEFKVKG